MTKQVKPHLLIYWPLWLLVIVWLVFSVYFITTLDVRSNLAASTATNTNTRVLDKSDATREICNANSGYTHEQCADVQSKFNTEYLCSSNGNDCWVEAK